MFELFFWARDRRTLAMEDGLIAHKIAAHAAKMEEGTWGRLGRASRPLSAARLAPSRPDHARLYPKEG